MDTSSQQDVKALPPDFRSFSSPAGAYVLELRGPRGWRPPQAQAELFSARPGARRSVWTKPLPHRYGPAQAVVSDEGLVLLLDEGLRTPGPLAVAVLARDGSETARYSTSGIAKAAGVTLPALIKSARVGIWMSAPPAMTPDGAAVVLEAAGVQLKVELHSGRLSRSRK
ncbi:hypothetical protein [Paludibaculum fermentans]|uniref:Uncharacterized protein n=1 Tax=Paludibaculum fermentans TaxID=1473598 RepID=A0A7S7NNV7_PALFE|nr:hypothetical protein [Paludibaculum fermentans]QOY87073.1 hypothetical protein IRI77_30550 [Paludibaculum fermentans]